MDIESIYNRSKRKLARGFSLSILALALSGCAGGPIVGAAVSLASGTLTAASDITSNVVGTAVDVATPDSKSDSTE